MLLYKTSLSCSWSTSGPFFNARALRVEWTLCKRSRPLGSTRQYVQSWAHELQIKARAEHVMLCMWVRTTLCHCKAQSRTQKNSITHTLLVWWKGHYLKQQPHYCVIGSFCNSPNTFIWFLWVKSTHLPAGDWIWAGPSKEVGHYIIRHDITWWHCVPHCE